jgi:glycosyltransferase involved in cell wall biosynthesis
MNILFLLRLWPVYGGGETVTIALANEFVKRGHHVGVLYFKDNSRNQSLMPNPEIQAVRLENIDCDEFHISVDCADTANRFLKTYIAEHHVDVVINQWWHEDYIKGIHEDPHLVVVKCLHQAFVGISLYGSPIMKMLKRCLLPIYTFRQGRKSIQYVNAYLPHVDRFVFLSKYFQKQYEEMSGYKDIHHKLDAIPNPLTYDSGDVKVDWERKEKVVLVVARMEETQKRISSILKAWKLIEKNYCVKDWKLQLVGEGRDLESYKQMAQKFDLRQVSFEGYQDPRPYYSKSKLFLMSSFFEGFSMTLVECSQYGVVPVVMDSFLALHDIVDNGVNGVITPDGDVKAFASAIYEMMQDDKRIKEYAQNAIRMCKRFSVENVADQWEKLFSDVRKSKADK